MPAGHTPGPWRLGKTADAVVCDTPLGSGGGHDDVGYYGGHLVAESIASHGDRHLIAAAPDLLAVVEVIVRLHRSSDQDHSECALCEAARAAIAKAEGKAA